MKSTAWTNVTNSRFMAMAVGAITLGSGCGKDREPNFAGGYAPILKVDPIKSKQIRTENKALVAHALSRMTEGQRIEVLEKVESQCQGTRSRYSLEKRGDLLVLHGAMNFISDETTRDPEKFNFYIEKVRACDAQIA